MTALSRNSKADTILLVFSPAGLDVDVSQERTNLTDHTTYVSETSSARTAITYPREISANFQTKFGDSGLLLSHGNATLAAYTYKIDIAGETVICYENGAEVIRLALPECDGDLSAYSMLWSTRAYDIGFVRSELTVCRLKTGTFAHAFATHAPCSTSSGYTFTLPGYGAGLSAFPIGQIESVRIGKRFHSQTEMREDWVDASTAPTITGTLRPAALPIDAGLPLGDEGGFAGPAYLVAGAAAREADRRLVGPVMNTRAVTDYSTTIARYAAEPRNYRTVPGAPTYRQSGDHVWRRPVPPNCNRVHARVFIRMYDLAIDGVADLALRMYSVGNYPYAGGGVVGPQVVHVGPVVTINADHPEGGGAWVDLGTLQVSRDDDGRSLFMLAHRIDPDSELAGDTGFEVRAVTLEPYYLPPAGGFDLTE